MRLITSDGKRSVDIGGSDIWFSVYSTSLALIGSKKKKVAKAIAFMETGKADGNEGYEIAKQFNLIRDELSQYPPEKAVYDINDKKKKAPWVGNLSPVITSCGNLYTTADGQDLFFEVVSIFVYAQIKKIEVIAE